MTKHNSGVVGLEYGDMNQHTNGEFYRSATFESSQLFVTADGHARMQKTDFSPMFYAALLSDVALLVEHEKALDTLPDFTMVTSNNSGEFAVHDLEETALWRHANLGVLHTSAALFAHFVRNKSRGYVAYVSGPAASVIVTEPMERSQLEVMAIDVNQSKSPNRSEILIASGAMQSLTDRNFQQNYPDTYRHFQ